MKLTNFDYKLPNKLIAKVPLVPRDTSKLLVLNKQTGEIIDDHFFNLEKYLNPGDLLVRNNTKVIPARIYGRKKTGGKIEVLLTKKTSHSPSTETWECITKPGIKLGQLIHFDSIDNKNKLEAKCLSENKNNYTKLLEFNQMGPKFIETLEKIGITPLPPYIANTTKDSRDIREKYQTIYAKYDGSAAAPTAGLHFTKDLEEKLLKKNINLAEITLHVGLGTFLPVKTENILEHQMHSEWFEVKPNTAKIINNIKNSGKRIICVGTTSARVLESVTECKNDDNRCKKENCFVKEQSGNTDIFMYPGYQFKMVDCLITNFHLPKSTLLMLVSALTSKPNTDHQFKNFIQSTIGKAYLHAIENNYRFYSFGDAMLII